MGKPKMLGYQKPVPNNRADFLSRKRSRNPMDRVKLAKDIKVPSKNATPKADVCVCCGEIVPEGRQVCPPCETEAGL